MPIDKNPTDETPDLKWLEEEFARIDRAVDEFAGKMKNRMREKAMAGWKNWMDRERAQEAYTALVAQAAAIPLARGQEVDIANYAMILDRFNAGMPGEQGGR